MANRQQRRASKSLHNEATLSPEQLNQKRAEEEMIKFIDENGIEAMIDMQIAWKLNDNAAKQAASSNVKAWFETAYELCDLEKKGLLDIASLADNLCLDKEEFISYVNSIKVNLYKEVSSIYEKITAETFTKEDYVNPFAATWEEYEGDRSTITNALTELYAWSIYEDPIIWAAQIHNMVEAHIASQFTEEETD